MWPLSGAPIKPDGTSPKLRAEAALADPTGGMETQPDDSAHYAALRTAERCELLLGVLEEIDSARCKLKAMEYTQAQRDDGSALAMETAFAECRAAINLPPPRTAPGNVK